MRVPSVLLSVLLFTGALGVVWLFFWIIGTRKLQPIGSLPEKAPVNWSEMLRDRRSWAVIGAQVLTDAVWWFVLLWMPDFFNREFEMGQADLGWPIAIIFSLAALGAMSSGALFPILLSRGLSLKSVAAQVGLFPPARLAEAFERRFGVAPRLFRDMHAEL